MGFHPFCGLRPFVQYRPLTMRGGPPFGTNVYGMEARQVLDLLWTSNVGNSAAMHWIARSVASARAPADFPVEAWPPGLLYVCMAVAPKNRMKPLSRDHVRNVNSTSVV
jgi:hypothetical protein